MITPIITEKTMKLAKDGKYSFWVPMNLTKLQIRDLLSQTFGVHVKEVRTVNLKPLTKRNMRGRYVKVKGGKKAVVTLMKDEKIDIFEEEKKTKAKKGSK